MTVPAGFSASFMSDAKWRKVFRVLVRHSAHVHAAKWKLIGDASPCFGHLPQQDDIWETAVDNCLNGPVAYAAIEWIELPFEVLTRRYDAAAPSITTQDVLAVHRELRETGEFPLEETGEGVRIYGYRR